jgi:hypothetical protein
MSPQQIQPSLTGGASLGVWWAVPGVLAGMPMPLLHPERRERFGGTLDAFTDDLPLLVQAGIGAVVSLLNIPGDAAVYSSAGFGYHLMPIPDGAAPSIEQFVAFLRFIREQRALGAPSVSIAQPASGAPAQFSLGISSPPAPPSNRR